MQAAIGCCNLLLLVSKMVLTLCNLASKALLLPGVLLEYTYYYVGLAYAHDLHVIKMVLLENDAVFAGFYISPSSVFMGGFSPLMILPAIDVVPFGADEDVSKVERPRDGVSHHEEV